MAASVSVQSAASPEVDEFQTLLYGADPTPGVVAVEAAGETAILLRREAGALRREERPFPPGLLANEIAALADARGGELEGPGCPLPARVPHWGAVRAGRETLRRPRPAPGGPAARRVWGPACRGGVRGRGGGGGGGRPAGPSPAPRGGGGGGPPPPAPPCAPPRPAGGAGGRRGARPRAAPPATT